MTAEEFYQLLASVTREELRNIITIAWALNPAIVTQAAQLAHCAGRCTCDGTVSHDGTFTPAVA